MSSVQLRSFSLIQGKEKYLVMRIRRYPLRIVKGRMEYRFWIRNARRRKTVKDTIWAKNLDELKREILKNIKQKYYKFTY